MKGFNSYELLLVAPLIVLFLASLIPLMIKVFRGNQEMKPAVVNTYGMIGLLGAIGFTLILKNTSSLAFSKAIIFDGLSFIASLCVFGVGIFSLLFCGNNANTLSRQYSEHVFLLLNSLIGMVLVAISNDLIVTFIGIELMSLCLYMLIAIGNEQRLSKEASIKYFILSSFATAIFLYGVSFIFGSVNTTYLDEIARVAPSIISTSRLFMLGVVMVVVGFSFKIALFPFQSWLPDVYQGAPTPITGLMATGVKVVSFVALLRFVLADVLLGVRSLPIIEILEWLAVLTIFVGNLTAIVQSNLKRMLAYSGIAHSGYAILGILAAGVGGDSYSLGTSSVIFYVVIYSLMTLGAFGFVSLLESKADSSIEIDDLKGFASKNPWLAAFFSLFMLSLAGVPPLAGFFTKLFILSGAIKQGFFWLAVWAVLGSVVSLYYYLRPVVNMYMHKDSGQEFIFKDQKQSLLALSVAALGVVFLGIFSSPVYDFIFNAVKSI